MIRFRHVLMNVIVGEACQAHVAAPIHDLGLISLRRCEDSVGDLLEGHRYTPTRTLRNRAGAAPWPVPITCMGSPLPQLGVPHIFQLFSFPIASQEFQNSGVIPA